MARPNKDPEQFTRPLRRVLMGLLVLFLLALFVLWRIDSPRVERFRAALVDRFVPSFQWAMAPVTWAEAAPAASAAAAAMSEGISFMVVPSTTFIRCGTGARCRCCGTNAEAPDRAAHPRAPGITPATPGRGVRDVTSRAQRRDSMARAMPRRM